MKMIRKALAVITCLFVLSISCIFAANNEKGIDYYRAELYDAAKIFLKGQIGSSQGNDLAEAYYYLGESYAATEDVDSAAYYYEKAIGADPEYPYAYIGQGKLSLMKKDDKAASDSFKKATGFAKKNPAVMTAIAEAYIEVNQFDKAIENLDKARGFKKDYSGIYVAEGDMLMAQEKVGDASAKYESAILFDSKDKVAYLKEARVYKVINPDFALEILERLLAVDPNYIPAYAELGEVYYRKNNYNKAIEAYDKFINIPGVPLRHHVNYASLLYFTKDYNRSLVEIGKILQNHPDNLVMKRLRIYNNYELEKYDEGIAQAENFINIVSADNLIAQDYMYYARLLDKNKEYDKAIENFNKAIELDDTKSDVYKDIAGTYERLNDLPKAADYYKLYIDNDKNATLLDVFNFGRTSYYAASKFVVKEDEDTRTESQIAEDNVKREAYLAQADTVFSEVIERSPDSYLGYFWKARVKSQFDPETEEGLAKPYYEQAMEKLEASTNPNKSQLIESYRYLGYYSYLKEDMEATKLYFNKILELNPDDEAAKQILEAL